MEEIAAITFFFELPNDLGLEGVAIFAFDEAEPWQGWTPEAMAGLIQFQRALEPGRRPTHRMVFRRSRVRVGLSLQAVDKAFKDWVFPLLPLRGRVQRRVNYFRVVAKGLRAFKTVVGVTAFVPVANLPDQPSESWLSEQADTALKMLNEYLVTFGIEADDPEIGPVSLVDLPAIAPAIMETQPVPTNRRQGALMAVGLHRWMPDVLPQAVRLDAAQRAADFFRAYREGDAVFFPTLELSQAARRDALAGRREQAVLAVGTAAELLVATAVRETWKPLGHNAAKLDGVLASGFRNLYETHLARALDTRIDVSKTTDRSALERWWHNGYLLRNRVAHEGYRPSASEVSASIEALHALIAEVGDRLRARPETAGIGDQLPAVREILPG